MGEDLSEIGIRKDAFYFDICYFLKNLNNVLRAPGHKKYSAKPWNLLPIIFPRNKKYKEDVYLQDKMKKGKRYLDEISRAEIAGINVEICLSSSCFLGEGSFGKVYKSNFDNRKIVIKEPKEGGYGADLEVFEENMVQSELFCGLRGQWGSGARIPKIEFMARLYMPKYEMKIITGLETLDGDLYHLVRDKIRGYSKPKLDELFESLLVQICELLIKLQDKYNFHHRDLHGGNIMYKNIGTSDNPRYRWYIIDFGMSYIKLGNVEYHTKPIGLYNRWKGNDFNHDLRILFPYISTFMRVKEQSVYVKFINALTEELKKEYRKNKLLKPGTLWHNSYYAINHKLATDIYTNPRTLLEFIRTNKDL